MVIQRACARVTVVSLSVCQHDLEDSGVFTFEMGINVNLGDDLCPLNVALFNGALSRRKNNCKLRPFNFYYTRHRPFKLMC